MSQHRFGRFVLDSLSRQLLYGERPVHLSPKAFRLLQVLVETRPKAWSKAELHEHLWPDVVVVEANLANLVAELRRALRDDRTRQRFIRTLPRFGYAFHAGVPASDERLGTGLCCRVTWAGGKAVLTAGEHLVGRDPDVAVLIAEPSVSRHHARVKVSDAIVTYEDLGSKNGSYRAGRRLDADVRLLDGDVVRVGLVDVTFGIHRSGGSTRTAVE
jgi:DNA-binding winged helix-turn-helix (wHTH) protein